VLTLCFTKLDLEKPGIGMSGSKRLCGSCRAFFAKLLVEQATAKVENLARQSDLLMNNDAMMALN